MSGIIRDIVVTTLRNRTRHTGRIPSKDDIDAIMGALAAAPMTSIQQATNVIGAAIERRETLMFRAFIASSAWTGREP